MDMSGESRKVNNLNNQLINHGNWLNKHLNYSATSSVTVSVPHGLSWKGNTFSGGQQMPCLHGTQSFTIAFIKSLSPEPAPCQLNPAHRFTTSFFDILSSAHRHISLSSWVVYIFHLPRVTCLAHLIILDIIALAILRNESISYYFVSPLLFDPLRSSTGFFSAPIGAPLYEAVNCYNYSEGGGGHDDRREGCWISFGVCSRYWLGLEVTHFTSNLPRQTKAGSSG